MKNVSLAARRLACPRASLNILICDKASEALIKRALILAGITIAMCATPARAWDDQGHMMVAAVAWEKLNPAVKKRAIELLKLNPDYETFIARVPSELQDQVAFVRAATWPDMIKKDPRYTNDGDDNSAPNSSLNIGYRDNLQHRYWHFIDLPFSTDGSPLIEPKPSNAELVSSYFDKQLLLPPQAMT